MNKGLQECPSLLNKPDVNFIKMKRSFQISRKMTATYFTTNGPKCWIWAYWGEFIGKKGKSIDATNGEETEKQSAKRAHLFCPD